MLSFMVTAITTKIYSETLSDQYREITATILSQSRNETDWADIIISMSGVEKDFEEENDSEIDKSDHQLSFFVSLYTFPLFSVLKFHLQNIEITHLFADIKTSHCPGLYILYKSIVI